MIVILWRTLHYVVSVESYMWFSDNGFLLSDYRFKGLLNPSYFKTTEYPRGFYFQLLFTAAQVYPTLAALPACFQPQWPSLRAQLGSPPLPRQEPTPALRRPGSPRPCRAPGVLPTFTSGPR